jgi:hypothetical protein
MTTHTLRDLCMVHWGSVQLSRGTLLTELNTCDVGVAECSVTGAN